MIKRCPIPFLLAWAIFLLPQNLRAQWAITGTVKNTDGAAIVNASIKLYKAKIITAFALSDAKGQYKLSSKAAIGDTLLLEVSHIGHEPQKISIVAQNQALYILMRPSTISLPEVKIKVPPIAKIGDTLSYDVRLFSAQQDRVIGDVIKKLPGVEVTESGQIKYNGKAISNYYIDGLDMLENKYNLANQNITIDMVDKVQILENHQPLKIFDSLTVSSTPALNIKLKSNAKSKLFVNVTAGIGYDTSLLWSPTVTVMQFSKKKQFLNGLKLNNAGDDFAADLSEQLTLDNLDQIPRFESKNDLLFLQQPTLPFIKRNRFVLNDSKLLFGNGLFSLKNSAQLKYSINLLDDRQRFFGNNQSRFFLLNDTVSVIENHEFATRNKMVKAELKYTLNESRLYISNKTNYTGYHTQANGNILGTVSLRQNLENPSYHISNDLMVYKKVKRQLFQFNSYLLLRNLPQQLNVQPGQFADVFNNGNPFQALVQSAAKKELYTSNILSTKTNFLKFQQKLSLRVDYLRSTFVTGMDKWLANNPVALPVSFQNDLLWNKLHTEIRPELMLYRKKFRLTAALPLLHVHLDAQNDLADTAYKRNFLFWLPTVTFFKPINQFIELNIGLNTNMALGNIANTASGFMMNNYRFVESNDNLLSVEKIRAASLLLTYRNARKAVFGYINTAYSVTRRNLVYDQAYVQTLLTTKALPVFNNTTNYQLSGNMGKYFPRSKTTASANVSYNRLSAFLYNNNRLVPFNNRSVAVKYSMNTKGIKHFFVEYTGTFTNIESSIGASANSNRVFQSAQDLGAYAFVSKTLTLGLFFSYNSNKATQFNQYFFADASLSFKNKKHEIDFRVNNMFDTRTFLWIDINDNSVNTIAYRLRPVNAMVRYLFKF
jgi:hypothetical protein